MDGGTLTLEGLATASSVLVAAVTYWLASRRDRAIRRAELVYRFSSDFAGDPELVEIFTDIDYNRFEFVPDRDTWLGTSQETRTVRLLDLFNGVGLNWKNGTVKLEEVHGTTLGYAIARTHKSAKIQAYLEHVDKSDDETLATGTAFAHFRQFAEALEAQSSLVRDGKPWRLRRPQAKPHDDPPNSG